MRGAKCLASLGPQEAEAHPGHDGLAERRAPRRYEPRRPSPSKDQVKAEQRPCPLYVTASSRTAVLEVPAVLLDGLWTAWFRKRRLLSQTCEA